MNLGSFLKKLLPGRMNLWLTRGLARCDTWLLRKGDIRKRYAYRSILSTVLGPEFSAMVKGQFELLRDGFKFSDASQTIISSPVERRVFYCLHNSLPYMCAGYAIRSHNIVSALGRCNWEALGVTRLGFPHDRSEQKLDHCKTEDTTAGERYLRLIDTKEGYGRIPQNQYLDRYCDALEKLAREYKPQVLHSASNYLNGVAAVEVARRLGIPSVYEVRGLWQVTRISRDPQWEDSDQDKLLWRMELDVMRMADRVLTLNRPLAEMLISKGIPAAKISIVGNAAEVCPRDKVAGAILRSQWGWDQRFILGYIGSIVPYEGLDVLLMAIQILNRDQSGRYGLIIVGDGSEKQKVKGLVEKLDLTDTVKVLDSVPHEEVINYYGALDLAVLPRLPQPVTNLVTPLKIFELMASQTPVLASNVSAMREVCEEANAGFMFEAGDVEHLAFQVKELASSPTLLEQSAVLGVEFIRNKANWTSRAQKIVDVYEELIQ